MHPSKNDREIQSCIVEESIAWVLILMLDSDSDAWRHQHITKTILIMIVGRHDVAKSVGRHLTLGRLEARLSVKTFDH